MSKVSKVSKVSNGGTMRSILVGIVATLVLVPPAVAQGGATPYAGMTGRAIKALSDEDVVKLRNGEGMGMALAAELNNFPGPKHLLELADSLGIDAATRQRVEAIRLAMNGEARALGARIVTLEGELDKLFVERTISARELDRRTEELGRLQGKLRAVHLAAHLDVTKLLTHEQIMRYAKLRGYDRGGAHQHQH